MSVFSEKLNQLARKKEIKMYQLAEHCGLDRSTVYKYLRGARSVKSLELVNKFVEALQLDPTQTNELIEAYKISQMGDENFYRRKKVLEFFNSFSPTLLQNETPVPAFIPQTTKNTTLPTDCQVYEGEERINAVLQTALSAELFNTNGTIQIIAQPEYHFLFQMLSVVTGTDRCKIHHIFCLDNTNSIDATLYNLDCLKTVTKPLLSQPGYIPYYFYDSVNAHFRNHMLLSNLLVTSTCAIQISYDLHHAVYYTGKRHVDFFRGIFTDALKRSAPMIKRLNDISDSLVFYLTQYTKSGQPQGSCNAEPCLVPYLNRALLEKYTEPIEHRSELLDLFVRYTSIQGKTAFTNKSTEYFSAEGVDYFCRTGYMWQIPAYAVTPLEPADRYELLRRFHDNRTETNTFLLKKNAPLSLGKLETVVWRDGGTSFVYEHSPDQYTAFFLSEKSLSFCFADFFAYVHESDMAYSNEDSMRYIEEKMDELKHKFM